MLLQVSLLLLPCTSRATSRCGSLLELQFAPADVVLGWCYVSLKIKPSDHYRRHENKENARTKYSSDYWSRYIYTWATHTCANTAKTNTEPLQNKIRCVARKFSHV